MSKYPPTSCPYCGSNDCTVLYAMKWKWYESDDNPARYTVSPFYREDEFSYFFKFDELMGVVACPGVVLPTLNEAAYISVDELDVVLIKRCPYEDSVPDDLRRYLPKRS